MLRHFSPVQFGERRLLHVEEGEENEGDRLWRELAGTFTDGLPPVPKEIKDPEPEIRRVQSAVQQAAEQTLVQGEIVDLKRELAKTDWNDISWRIVEKCVSTLRKYLEVGHIPGECEVRATLNSAVVQLLDILDKEASNLYPTNPEFLKDATKTVNLREVQALIARRIQASGQKGRAGRSVERILNDPQLLRHLDPQVIDQYRNYFP